jgi:uncharacterized protein YjbI with pentapeptide repeats
MVCLRCRKLSLTWAVISPLKVGPEPDPSGLVWSGLAVSVALDIAKYWAYGGGHASALIGTASYADLDSVPRDDVPVRLPHRRSERERTRPAWRPIPAWSWMLAAVAAVAIVAFVVTTWLLTIASHASPGTDRATARLDAVRTGLAAGAGAGAAVGLMLAFRRQHHQEIVTVLTDLDATERRITELYTKAVEQLGIDKAPVRLGGLYALERLAQDTPAHRQTIVNVMCAYLRMPFSPAAPTSKPVPEGVKDPGDPATKTETRTIADDDTWQQEKQVRLTAQRILAEHLRGDRAEDQQPADSPSTLFWLGIRLDLTGATLIDFNLENSVVADASFRGATFTGHSRFREATFTSGADFGGATFNSFAMFGKATFNGSAVFERTAFKGGAEFDGVTFNGTAGFIGATVDHASGFGGAIFNGIAEFAGATFKEVAGFGGATFKERALFGGATFDEPAVFVEVTFNGFTEFSNSRFTGFAGFNNATFNEAIRFQLATFTGNAEFDEVTFMGDAWFGSATFTGDVRFGGATFTGSADRVSFEGSQVLSPDAQHVWPMGWRMGQTDGGGHRVVRANGDSRS